jgi:hypothetical protein
MAVAPDVTQLVAALDPDHRSKLEAFLTDSRSGYLKRLASGMDHKQLSSRKLWRDLNDRAQAMVTENLLMLQQQWLKGYGYL